MAFKKANPAQLQAVEVQNESDAPVPVAIISGGGGDSLTDAELRATAVPVSVSGGATATKQDTGNTSLASLDTNQGETTDAEAAGDGSVIAILKRLRTLLAGVLNVRPASPAGNDYLPVRLTDGADFYEASGGGGGGLTDAELRATAVPVSVSGVATATKQDTGNTSLASIDSKVTAVNTGAVVVASSALPSGAATAANQSTANASLANAETSLALLDDWDESDRAKVNLIAGQAGITAGAGNVAANTPRITVAADDPLVTRLGEVQASPTANTVLDRLKALLTGIALAAGTNLIGKVASVHSTDTIYNGTTALTPKFAKIAASSSGNNTLVSAVSSKKIRVLAYNFIGNGAVNAKFQDGAGGTDLTGLKYLAAAGGGICAPYNPVGWFETSSNTLLNLNLSAAVAVGGELVYVEV